MGPRNLRNERPPLCCRRCGRSLILHHWENTDEKCSERMEGVECECVSVESIDKHRALNLKDLWSYNIFMGGVTQYSRAISKMQAPAMYSFQWRHVRVRGFNKLIHILVLSYQHKYRSGLGWSFTVMLLLNTWLHHHLAMSGILCFLHDVLHIYLSVHVHCGITSHPSITVTEYIYWSTALKCYFEILSLVLSITIFCYTSTQQHLCVVFKLLCRFRLIIQNVNNK